MLPISARVRPYRSATTPNATPPTAPATSVTDPISPAVALVSPRSLITAVSTSA